MADTKKICHLKISRGESPDARSYDTFSFVFEDGQSVLDALLWVRESCDPSLAVRFSCLNANACKECVMLIDGQVSYACTKRVLCGSMLIEPLPNKALIRDLVTEIVLPVERLSVGNFCWESE